MLLLGLGHLAKLPELVLLENTKSLKVRNPLFSDLVIVDVLGSFVGPLRIKILATDYIYKFVVLRLFLGAIFASGRLVGGCLKGAF